MTLEQLWQATLGELEVHVRPRAFRRWLQNTALLSVDGGVAVIAVPDRSAQLTLAKEYGAEIRSALDRILMTSMDLEFRIRVRDR